MLTDQFGRPFQDLRISVTDRCNFRCTYCMPKEIFGSDYAFMQRDELLSFEEIERLVKIFVEFGVKKVRLTGGEPLLRKDLYLLVRKLKNIEGLEDIGLTSNAFLMEKHAKSLKESGLDRVNVSLDAIDDEVFSSINDVGVKTKRVLQGIEAARDAGLGVKVKKGMNDQEILPMARYFKSLGVTLRFIEFMDVGTSNGWDFKHVVTKKEMFEQLSQEFNLEPVDKAYLGEVAQRYRYKGTDTEVGFITSVSETFCSTCTRGRLSADGKFYNCLFASSGFDLRELLRSGKSDEEIRDAFIPNWKNRDDRYSDERTEETVKQRKKIEMSYIGG